MGYVSAHVRMRPYSQDLRTRIVKAVQQKGVSKSAAAATFEVSLSSVRRYVRMSDRGEALVARRKGGGRAPNFDQTTKELLEEDVKERPGPTVYERSCFVE